MPTRSADAGARGGAPLTGLVLTGGGARAAYQVGVLKAVYRLLGETPGSLSRNPFPIICGTSAGAINATALACGAENPRAAMRRLYAIWENLRTERVYRSDSLGVMRTGARWLSMLSFGWMLARLRRSRPRSLLDNAPLGELLALTLDFHQLEDNLANGALEALAVTASGYTSGRHLTFYQTRGAVGPWQRSLRRAVRDRIAVDHLLASSAIPFIFPARRIQVGDFAEWCGDGAMRQLAPISPAIHLGAERVLVIGAGRSQENPTSERDLGYPTLAQIGAHALSNIFLDSLSADIEQLSRTNQVADLLSPDMRRHLGIRQISVLAITPSRNLDEIAASHVGEMPATMRALLGAVGVSGDGRQARGAGLVSYLLFEPGYTRELIALGWSDAMARASEVRAFFSA
ncbi:patatin-like phospholipase family protein [Verticiella sediminum]|uniref:Patatin-like phospholipase family protein n=1 Tax=Verticiella sediminum TaxID=1247510 RepID=A0A556AVS8_9BURK|nr:patatin-like phospholipase family protein [Verticiella sediminum]TSH97027.1 patatin-like phospholipase family protein [Verticiella sediminum]